MKIAIGADHGGYELKERMKKYIAELGHECMDVGTFSTERCDYPDYAFQVAAAVSTKKCDYGIMIDAVGIGSSVMCNKVPGVRAAVANEIYSARNAKLHNGTNVLCIGSLIIGDGVAKEIIKIWLETDLAGERNIQRVNQINEIEQRILGCNNK
ncbi:ribose 5-phosphate isomerase B [Faecalicatena contorta]|uniref:ribose 5-phosphate isomerase B n=1 Tax=Faecalicatena contorta TaxID=39482 RepID=UPI001F2816A1|nr:ribose 5-phosphate isomerase B [Faecalicatena contorta]MCF2555422.1 ribose 5-phosphate isomerase B [Faecalicatena contorta]